MIPTEEITIHLGLLTCNKVPCSTDLPHIPYKGTVHQFCSLQLAAPVLLSPSL